MTIRKTTNQKLGLHIAIVASVVMSQILLLLAPLAGVFTNVVLLIFLSILALRDKKLRVVAIAVSVLPITNFICMAFPQTNTFNQALIFYCTMLLLAIVYRYMFIKDKSIRLKKLKFKNRSLFILSSIVMGVVLGALTYGLVRDQYQFIGTPLSTLAVALIVFAIAEELLFRGLIQEGVAKTVNSRFAAISTAILYTAAAIPLGITTMTFIVLISGVVLSAIYYLKHSLMLTITTNLIGKFVLLGALAAFS